jgi:UDP-glucose 4-epimerase
MSKEQTWLLTGGAGYIGSHIADEFIRVGKSIVIYDSLYQGLESRIEFLRKKYQVEIPLVVADILDFSKLDEVIKKYNIDGIVHAAALKAVGESVAKPELYFQVNLRATIELLKIAEINNVKSFIFSSTAAVYGSPDSTEACREDGQVAPTSPYGASKLQAEEHVKNFLEKPGHRGTSLRFFNVIGSAASPELVDNSVGNLVPTVINRVKNAELPVIFGTDYPTADGTCIRDYVDVRDIARAHLVAADCQDVLPTAINVGTGRGASVREIIKLVLAELNQSDTKIIDSDRRAGDPAYLCADVRLAQTALKFKTRYSLEESIASTF